MDPQRLCLTSPRMLALILAHTRLADLASIRGVCRRWRDVKFVYEPVIDPEPDWCQRCTREGPCSVCWAQNAALSRDRDARINEHYRLERYVAMCIPYEPLDAMDALIAMHRDGLSPEAVYCGNAFFRACVEGDLRAAQWVYRKLGFTTATPLHEGFSCGNMAAIIDTEAMVEGFFEVVGDEVPEDDKLAYIDAFLFIKHLATANHCDVGRWIMAAFSGTQVLRKVAVHNLEWYVGGLIDARRYVSAFALSWGDFEPVSNRTLELVVGKRNPRLLAWLVEELKCPEELVWQSLALEQGQDDVEAMRARLQVHFHQE